MKVYIFKGRILHNNKEFVKGQACPDDMLAEMNSKGLVELLPEPVKPVEPVPAPAQPSDPRAKK